MEKEDNHLCRSFGIAIDLGTTYINIALIDLNSCKELWYGVKLNPQSQISADIIQRLVSAKNSKKQARQLKQSVVDAILETLYIAVKEIEISLGDIISVAIVGNTAMLSLFSGKNYDTLLDPEYWMSPVDCSLESNSELIKSWKLSNQAQIKIIQPLGGFVGSDLLSGLIYTKIDKIGSIALFIDFGTNSEIALWDGNKYWITSTAGGPAFEGGCISNGMPAVKGAIYRLQKVQGNNIEHCVIGGGEPKGICGSAMIDALAYFLKEGLLKQNGRFSDKGVNELNLPALPFSMNHQDIDILQRAKAAIAAGWETLCIEAGISIDKIDRIYVGGAFGEYLNPKHAIQIGLLPLVSEDKVHICGNSALKGCKHLICDQSQIKEIDKLRDNSKLLNLASVQLFEDRFFQNLFLKPVDTLIG